MPIRPELQKIGSLLNTNRTPILNLRNVSLLRKKSSENQDIFCKQIQTRMKLGIGGRGNSTHRQGNCLIGCQYANALYLCVGRACRQQAANSDDRDFDHGMLLQDNELDPVMVRLYFLSWSA